MSESRPTALLCMSDSLVCADWNPCIHSWGGGTAIPNFRNSLETIIFNIETFDVVSRILAAGGLVIQMPLGLSPTPVMLL